MSERASKPSTRRRSGPADAAPLLMLDGVTVRLGGLVRVRELTLDVRAGEIVALRGESGSGKTTVLRAAAGLVPVAAGRVVRRVGRTGMVFQDPRLLPWRSVLDNVLFALGARPNPDQLRHAAALLDRLGLHAVHRAPPATLSGGMRQRVGLVRALLVDADLLLADEPFAHLDPHWAGEVAQILREQASAGAAVLLAAHETELVSRVADRVHMMSAPSPSAG